MARSTTTLPGNGDYKKEEPAKADDQDKTVKDLHKEHGEFLKNNSMPGPKDPPDNKMPTDKALE